MRSWRSRTMCLMSQSWLDRVRSWKGWRLCPARKLEDHHRPSRSQHTFHKFLVYLSLMKDNTSATMAQNRNGSDSKEQRAIRLWRKPDVAPVSTQSQASNYVAMDDRGMDQSMGAVDFHQLPLSPAGDYSERSRQSEGAVSAASLNPRSSRYRTLSPTARLSSQGSFGQSDDFQKMLSESKENPPLLEKDDSDEEEVYLVKQNWGYLSIFFSFAQTVILATMMIQCGVAPFQINPMIGPYPDALSDWGAKNAVNIIDDGEWWRLITPIMLHAGVIHLLCNIAVQLDSGAFFEREWGSLKWLIVYLSSAVGSSILSVIFMPGAISVGSSGAVMGLFGAKLSEVICRFCESDKTKQERVGHQVRKEQCAGVTCSVIVVGLFSFIPYVDWAAHLGGLLAGFCVGMILFSLDILKQMWKLFWLLLGIAMTVVYFAVTLQHMYSGDVELTEELRDVCGYYKEYFEDYECNCMLDEQQE